MAKKVIFLSFFFSQIPEGNIKEESKGCLIFGDESESHLHNLLFLRVNTFRGDAINHTGKELLILGYFCNLFLLSQILLQNIDS